MRRTVPVLVLGAATIAAAGAFAVVWKSSAAAASRGDPAAFAERVVRLVAANRYAEAWDLLDPRQQAFVPRNDYVRCEQLTPIPGRLARLERHGVRDETVRVPGTAQVTTVKGVTLKLVITGVTRVTLTHTFHAVAVGGSWRWYLPSARLAAYSAGYCPGMRPAPPTLSA